MDHRRASSQWLDKHRHDYKAAADGGVPGSRDIRWYARLPKSSVGQDLPQAQEQQVQQVTGQVRVFKITEGGGYISRWGQLLAADGREDGQVRTGIHHTGRSVVGSRKGPVFRDEHHPVMAIIDTARRSVGKDLRCITRQMRSARSGHRICAGGSSASVQWNHHQAPVKFPGWMMGGVAAPVS